MDQPRTSHTDFTYRHSLIFLGTATFFFWTALYLYVPILPAYAESLGANLSMVGAIVSSYAIAQLLLRIPIGIWGDAAGKQKFLAIGGIVLVTVGALSLALSTSPWFLYVARAITGAGAATWVAFTVLYASYFSREQSSRAIGMVSFINGIAMVSATAVGGLVAEVWGYKAACYGAVVLGAIAMLAIAPVHETGIQKPAPPTWNGLVKLAFNPLLLTASGLGILVQFCAFAGVFGFVPVYAKDIGASPADLGFLTMLTLIAFSVSALFAPRLAERMSYKATIIIGSACMAFGFITIPWIKSLPILDITQVVNGIGRGFTTTIFLALSIRVVQPEQRATAMGIYQAIYAIGILLGPLVSGFIANNLGLAAVFYGCTAISVLLALLVNAVRLPDR